MIGDDGGDEAGGIKARIEAAALLAIRWVGLVHGRWRCAKPAVQASPGLFAAAAHKYCDSGATKPRPTTICCAISHLAGIRDAHHASV